MVLKDFFGDINFDWETCIIELGSGSQIYQINSDLFQISPYNFLEYANHDLLPKSDHGYVNSITNTKRAIECQMEIILDCFGFKYKNLNFPNKIKLLNELGLFSPELLIDINKLRVDLEHNYKNPDPSMVKKYYEIAELFLDATTFFLSSFWDNFFIVQKSDAFIEFSLNNGLHISFNTTNKFYSFRYCLNQVVTKEIIVDSSNKDDFLLLTKFILKISKYLIVQPDKVDMTFREFISDIMS